MQYTALYERLSRDDELQGESNSIKNQKEYLEHYAKDNGFNNFRHFVDDGYSGTNFERPAFTEMIEEIKEGNISTVIVKDMSRFGRNYLEVGFYTEMFFPKKKVRFIAIGNNIDSIKENENDFTPFVNIMNEWYAKDTSKKIRTVFKERMKSGKRCSGSVPYGFYRKEGDKNTLYVDENVRDIVKHIYQLAVEGNGVTQIAKILTDEHVMIPTAYFEKYRPEMARTHTYHDPYIWNSTTVSRILRQREYKGDVVLSKTVSTGVGRKARRKTTEDEIIIIPNAHEPIIDEDTWNTANRVINGKKYKRLANGCYTHMLSGLIYCADCGHRMSYKSPQAQHRKDGKVYDSDSAFGCPMAYNRYNRCSSHYIKTSSLEKLILTAINEVCRYVIDNENEFVRQVMLLSDFNYEKEIREKRKRLTEIENRLIELSRLIKKLYEDNVSGRIPERQFQSLISDYDKEQTTLETEKEDIEAMLSASKSEALRTDKFIKLVHRYTEVKELDKKLLNEFIERIEVHQGVGGKYHMTQQIDIYFNFIGQFQVPTSDDVIYQKNVNDDIYTEITSELTRKAI